MVFPKLLCEYRPGARADHSVCCSTHSSGGGAQENRTYLGTNFCPKAGFFRRRAPGALALSLSHSHSHLLPEVLSLSLFRSRSRSHSCCTLLNPPHLPFPCRFRWPFPLPLPLHLPFPCRSDLPFPLPLPLLLPFHSRVLLRANTRNTRSRGIR